MTNPYDSPQSSHGEQNNPYGSQPSASFPQNQPEPQSKPKKKRNTIGIIALVCAILGFIFACMPGALIVGWFLLPVAFILGIVALFMKGQPKGTGLAAIIISIIGTIVGILVFLFVVSSAVDGALKNGDTTASTSDGGEISNDQGSTRENPLPLGSTIEDDEFAVTINSVDLNATDAIMAENEFNQPPAEGQTYIMVNYTVTYKGTNPEGSVDMSIVNYVTPEGNSLDSSSALVVEPEPIDTLATLYEGASISGNKAFAVPAETADQGTLAVTPNVFGDKRFVSVK